jgi:hypothetical protein
MSSQIFWQKNSGKSIPNTALKRIDSLIVVARAPGSGECAWLPRRHAALE